MGDGNGRGRSEQENPLGADWERHRPAVEARHLAPLPADIDHTVAAALPISGLTAWQACSTTAASPQARPS